MYKKDEFFRWEERVFVPGAIFGNLYVHSNFTGCQPFHLHGDKDIKNLTKEWAIEVVFG
jgi:hypothetical protein